MPVIHEITDLTAPELDIYARLTQAQLRNRLEPEKGDKRFVFFSGSLYFICQHGQVVTNGRYERI